jgi:hypothetical protein
LGEAGNFAVPDQYASDVSTLKLDVKPGEQTFDIKMVKEAGDGKPAKKLRPVD